MARHSWKDVSPWEVEGFMSSDLLTESPYVGVRRCLKCGARAWYFGAQGSSPRRLPCEDADKATQTCRHCRRSSRLRLRSRRRRATKIDPRNLLTSPHFSDIVTPVTVTNVTRGGLWARLARMN